VKRNIATWVAASGLILGLSACTNPYDPAQRAIGGGLLGAGAGAAIGLPPVADMGRHLALQSVAPRVPSEASLPHRHRYTATAIIRHQPVTMVTKILIRVIDV
jgi:hypothetical protein